MVKWTTADIPTQQGRVAIVTGTGGLGLEDALALARAGAEVIVAGRNPARGRQAVSHIAEHVPSAKIRFEQIDLAALDSIASFADRILAKCERLDILINNAGIMVPPKRMETADGFELQLGTNHLGHFALTARLMPLLKRGASARVVSLSSVAARGASIDLDDLNATRRYRPFPVYAQSKLACLMFAFELQRRSAAGGWGISSVAAHPGLSRTELLNNTPGRGTPMNLLYRLFWMTMQPPAQGALPTLYAATAPEAEGGAYYGPNSMGETRGYPVPARTPARALDRGAAARLWKISEEWTRVRFA
jgi:NAD(P)-dependent dehydrogenase (short-subunit alcohol dehydrogenase family)